MAERQCALSPEEAAMLLSNPSTMGSNSTCFPGCLTALSEITTYDTCTCVALGYFLFLLAVVQLFLEVLPSCRAGLTGMSQGLARTRHPVGAQCSSTALSQILTHTQLSSLPKGQVGVPNRHAEVDAAVGRLHALEAESVPGRISKHS